MLPAEKLETGETRASLSAGMPGALLYPRVGAQVTWGFGGGDVTANVNATPLPKQAVVGGGLAVRSYLTDDLSLEVQFQGASFAGQAAGLALLGLQTIPSGEGGWYFGLQGGAVRGPSGDVLVGGRRGETRIWRAPVVGGTVGYGPIDLGPSTRMQVELKANMPVWGDEGEAPPATTGLSVGIFGLFE